MNPLRRRLRAAILRALARDVPMAQVRHDDRPVFVAEGYGGRPIEEFPPCGFYGLALAGREEEARAAWRAWYREQFRKHGREPKRDGGMRGGTLYRLVAALCAEDGVPFDGDVDAVPEPTLARAIERRVGERLDLLASIRTHGYLLSRSTPVLALRRSGAVYLTGGQHRAAALRALGHDTMPQLSVFSPALLRALKRIRVV